MVRSLRSSAFLIALLSAASGTQAAAAGRGHSIGVYIDFDAAPSAMAVAAMKREVGAIMKSTGLKMNWRKLKENRGTEAFDGLVVVRFKGKCHVQPWPDEPATGKITLASTIVSEGQVLPFTEVECEAVRKTLVYSGTTCDQERQCAFGRALGRVLAHELYHALARTTLHAGKGLAKATQSLRDLIAVPMRFNADDSEAIRRGLASPPGTFSFAPQTR